MQRVMAFSFIVLVAAAPLLGQQQRVRRPGPWLIYGPVHTIRDERANIKVQNGEVVEGPRVLIMTLTYSEDGTKQERTLYRPDGSIKFKTVDNYESDGRLIESKTFYDDGTLLTRIVNTYDSQKQLAVRVEYRSDGSISSRTMYHNQGNDREIEIIHYDKDGAVTGETRANTTRGSQASIQSYDPEGGATLSTQAEII